MDDMDGESGPSTNTTNAESDLNSESVDQLRREIKWLFMNPRERWKVKRQYPWKHIIQLVKVILITTQLTLFGISRSSHVDFLEKSNLAFHHLFLNKWEPGYETMPYPPATGEYAVYTIPDFYTHVNFAMEQFDKTEELALGTFQFSRPNNTHEPMQLCKTHFKKGMIWAFNESYSFDNEKVTECVDLHQVEGIDNKTGKIGLVYDTKKYLNSINQTIHFDRLIEISLLFTLNSVDLKHLSQTNTPDCYCFHIKIHYDNTEHGQMPITLKSHAEPLHCHMHVDGYRHMRMVGICIFHDICIVVSILSLILCLRSVIKAMHLKTVTVKFFKENRNTTLGFYDKLEFLNMWNILIIISDLLTIIGSIYKILIVNKVSYHYEVCSILLGSGNLFAWFGVLRILEFGGKFNILILTMKKSAPNVVCFLACAGVLYIAFAVCGWVVLGPYHVKFRQLSTTVECLFSLANGDDIFTTFASIDSFGFVWCFSRAYLYSFISLFIYMVLNVFTSVIIDASETIKKYNKEGFPKSTVQEFADEYTLEPRSQRLCICSLCRSDCERRHSRLEEPNETTRLI